MILPALNALYNRLIKDDQYRIAPPGWSVQKVSFCIVLEEDGSLHDIQDARETVVTTRNTGKSKKYQLQQLQVPGETKSSGPSTNPCTLWDNAGYLLGYKKPDPNALEKTTQDQQRTQETFPATRDHHLELEKEINDSAFSAVCRFLKEWDPENIDTRWTRKLDDFATTGNGVFRIRGEPQQYIHQTAAFRQWWEGKSQEANDEKEQTGVCLMTGQEGNIARVHEPAVKGVAGAAPSGAKLVSFNQGSFESYGKDQSYNAPVAKSVASHYGKALNALLDGPKSKRHRIMIGDATTVFWTECKTQTESLFASFFKDEVEGVEEGAGTEEDGLMQDRLDAFLRMLRRGGHADPDALENNIAYDDPDTRFYILGLSGNRSRLAVRFWYVCTIRELLERLREHFEMLALYRRPDADPYHEPEFPSANRLLTETAREKKNISPILAGQLMHTILQATSYPMTLLNGVIARIRAGDDITYLKAAILKAVLIRNFDRTIEMSLNTERTDPAYRLGRLFAALEKTQEDALGDINTGLRERYYSSASATPGSVFPRILRTYQHHLAKLKTPAKISREQLVQSIHACLDDYPSQLGLADQGLFAIGYYHQRQKFFTARGKQADDKTSGTETTPSPESY